MEYRLRQRDGGYQWIHTKGSVIQRDAEGRPEVAVGTSMNITERKQIEQVLRESEERLAQSGDVVAPYGGQRAGHDLGQGPGQALPVRQPGVVSATAECRGYR
jgi:PAS domain-containing protein